MTAVYKEAASVRSDLSVEIRATSIWDDSLFKVFPKFGYLSHRYFLKS
jgi:Gtr1/RagA G protein conserved region